MLIQNEIDSKKNNVYVDMHNWNEAVKIKLTVEHIDELKVVKINF